MPKEDPPLVSLKVTNPVTYIKIWWKKVMDNEGIDFSFRIRPLTAIFMAVAVTAVLTGAGFGLGRVTIPIPETIEKYIPIKDATPTPDPWRETALSGSLKYSDSTRKFYLVTTSIEAITLEVPGNIDLKPFVGKRILASGKYNKTTRTLIVNDAQSMEVLPTKAQTPPTFTPTPVEKFSPSPYYSPSEIPSPAL